MLLHIVMLKPKPGATDEEIQAALEHVKKLQPKIPGLLNVCAGKNLDNPDSEGYTHGFIMQFSDVAHMKAYFVTPQPDHEAWAMNSSAFAVMSRLIYLIRIGR